MVISTTMTLEYTECSRRSHSNGGGCFPSNQARGRGGGAAVSRGSLSSGTLDVSTWMCLGTCFLSANGGYVLFLDMFFECHRWVFTFLFMYKDTST